MLCTEQNTGPYMKSRLASHPPQLPSVFFYFVGKFSSFSKQKKFAHFVAVKIYRPVSPVKFLRYKVLSRYLDAAFSVYNYALIHFAFTVS